MVPKTPGQRLAFLRAALRLSQPAVHRMGGPTTLQVSRAERDELKFRSADLVEGFARAYGLTYEQMRAYLAGTMPFEAVLAIAKPHTERLQRELRAAKRGSKRVEDALRRASAQSRILPAAKAAAEYALAEREDLTLAEMVRDVLEINEAIRDLLDRYLRSDKSGS